MNIAISKKEIFDEVEKRTSLEGSVIPERLEEVWASPEEGHFLDSFWIEGYTAVVQLLKRYLASDTIDLTLNNQNNDEVIHLSVDMPERYLAQLDGNVSTDIKMMIVCNIIHGWLEIKLPDAAAKYDEEAKGYAEDLRVKLLHRTEPSNRFACGHSSDDFRIYPRCEFIEPAKKDCVRLAEQWGKCGCKEKEKRQAVCCEPCEFEPFGFEQFYEHGNH